MLFDDQLSETLFFPPMINDIRLIVSHTAAATIYEPPDFLLWGFKVFL